MAALYRDRGGGSPLTRAAAAMIAGGSPIPFALGRRSLYRYNQGDRQARGGQDGVPVERRRSEGIARPAVAIAALGAVAALAGTSAQGAIKYAVRRYATEEKAQKHCPKDAVVYSTGRDGVYFLKGDPEYGHIKNAWYVCRREADHGGWHLQAH